MSKHTPGPWQIDWYICSEGGKELWRAPRSIGPACVDRNHWAGDHIAVDAADARLIAAAPDLFEALKGLLLFPNNPRENLKARAAIAKATVEAKLKEKNK